MTQEKVKSVTYEIMSCCIEVHRELGPGLLESMYEECLEEELTSRGMHVERQKRIAVKYKSKLLPMELRVDLLVEDIVICEVKAVEYLLPVYDAQVLSYMKLLEKPKGLLVNFHSDNVSRNTRHFVNQYFNALALN